MKLHILLIFFAVVIVATIRAQQTCPICPQGVCFPNCTGVMDVGTNCSTARPRRLWYFDQSTRVCRPLHHLGCGGNNNRWCSLLFCSLRCALSIG